MADLSPEARAVIKAGRSALRATTGDRERIEASLRARLGSGALPPAGGPTRWLSLTSVTSAAIGVCMLGGVALWALRPHASAPAAKPVISAPAPLIIAPAAVQDVPLAPSAPPPAPRPPPPLRQDRSAQEVALLARATKELRAGHAGKALKALDEHVRRFPNGVLSEERRSARAQALCALGRFDEGRAEQERLPAQSPTSARAKQVCDSARSNHN